MSFDLGAIQRDAEMGNRTAQLALSRRFLAQGSVEEMAQAVKCLSTMAEDGVAEAQHLMGMEYLVGKRVKSDQRQAESLIRAAALKGVTEAQFHYGMLCKEGVGREKSDTEALTWIRAAADAGQPDACYYLGVYYESGGPVVKNDQEALKWYKRAAAFNLRFELKSELNHMAVASSLNTVTSPGRFSAAKGKSFVTSRCWFLMWRTSRTLCSKPP